VKEGRIPKNGWGWWFKTRNVLEMTIRPTNPATENDGGGGGTVREKRDSTISMKGREITGPSKGKIFGFAKLL